MIEILERSYSDSDERLLTPLAQLGNIAELTEDYVNAYIFFDRQLKIAEKVRGPGLYHPSSTSYLLSLILLLTLSDSCFVVQILFQLLLPSSLSLKLILSLLILMML